MNNIVLLCAMHEESQGLLESLGMRVFYTGVGKVNAAAKTAEVIKETGCTHLINVGSAGSAVFPAHTLVEVTSVVQRDMDARPLGVPLGTTPYDELPDTLFLPRLLEDVPQARCGTGDTFAVAPPELHCEVVDMELYAIAKVCARHGVTCHALKYMTDSVSEGGHEEFLTHLHHAAEALRNGTRRLLTGITAPSS